MRDRISCGEAAPVISDTLAAADFFTVEVITPVVRVF